MGGFPLSAEWGLFAVVLAEPCWHRGGALSGAFGGGGIGPLAQRGLDEALGLAVGARRAFFLLVGQKLGIGRPGVVVDGHVEVLPSCAMLVALAFSVAGDAMSDSVDAAELLDVDMDEFAGVLPLVADDGRPRIEGGKPRKAAAAQDEANRGGRPSETPCNGRPGETLPAQCLDLGLNFETETARALMRPRAVITKASPSAACRSRQLRTVFGSTPNAAAQKKRSSQRKAVQSSAFDYASSFWHSDARPSGAPRLELKV